MKVVNLYGSSGSGKSTTAAGLAYALKIEGFKVEIITEYAKELCILNTEHLLENQTWVFANQYQKMRYLSEELDFVITDSPLMLSYFYGKKYNYSFKSLFPLIEETYHSFDNINFFLEREHKWDQYARVQTEEESLKDSDTLKEFLNIKNISFTNCKTGNHIDFLKKYIMDTNKEIVNKLNTR